MIRILLYSPQSILGACLDGLLSQRSDLVVLGIERDPECVVQRVSEVRPDVVIAHSRDASLDPPIAQLLGQVSAPVVIVLSSMDNRLRLYRSEEWMVTEPEDLEQAIRAEPVLG